LEIRGRNLLEGGPGILLVPVTELAGIVERHAMHLVDFIRDVLIDTPPELSRDIHDSGIVLTGGGATLALLGRGIARATGLQILADQCRREAAALCGAGPRYTRLASLSDQVGVWPLKCVSGAPLPAVHRGDAPNAQ
jgi:actin-like ATPase involved in cell morphogenesis